MKKLVTILLFLLPVLAQATVTQPYDKYSNQTFYEYILRVIAPTVVTDYYVSSSGNDSNSGTSAGSPWQTLSKVETFANAGSLLPGDRVLFKSGESFSGALHIAASGGGRHAKSGTDALHITWTLYGGSTKPLFLYPGTDTAHMGVDADSRTILLLVGVRRWDFINLHFTDNNHYLNKRDGAHVGFTLYFGLPGSTQTNSCTVSYCDFDFVGMGPVLAGDSNIITHCNLSNFKNLLGDVGGGDYGANAFTLLDGNYNEVSYCYVHDAWAQSTTFGFNGGFAEIYGQCSYNKFYYNTIIDCNGVSEFGSNGATVTCQSNEYKGNKVLSCGAAFYANLAGVAAVQVSGTLYEQNTHIETADSRFTGSNCGHGLPDSAALHAVTNCDTRAFGNNGTVASPPIWIVKNNIFQFSTGCDIFQGGGTGSNYQHTYNYYKNSNGSSDPSTLGTGELSGSATLFVRATGSDPSTWDLTLRTTAPAYAAGDPDPSFPNDMNGYPFAGNMGAVGVQPIISNDQIIFKTYIDGVLYKNWN